MSEKKDTPEAVSDEALDQATGGLTGSFVGETEKRLAARSGPRLADGPTRPTTQVLTTADGSPTV
ncbi:MAG: hypothetical protein ACMVO5_00420 [Polymorphobacter sp.]|uniref:hypothetical protein n=1 Tax=Polymorphobacter sp. TaxID=1909290 RepID=UPI003A8537FD